MTVSISMRTGSGLNDRMHHFARARKVKKERADVGWVLAGQPKPKALPAVVVLRRVAPSNGLDDDNLRGSMKGVRDAVATWLGIDDRDPRVKWDYDQKRGPWAVELEMKP